MADDKLPRYEDVEPLDQYDYTRWYGEQPQLEEIPQQVQPISARSAAALVGAPAMYGSLDYGDQPRQRRSITPTPDDAITVGTSGYVIPAAQVRAQEGRTTWQDLYDAEYQRHYADRLRFFRSQGYDARRAAGLAAESAQFRAGDTIQQQQAMAQQRASADQWYGTANGGRPDLTGANAPNQGDFSINTLRGGRAGHTDFQGGVKVNDYQPGYHVPGTPGTPHQPDQIKIFQTGYDKNGNPQYDARVLKGAGGTPGTPGYNVPQQGYATLEEKALAEAKARGELTPLERQQMMQAGTALAEIESKVREGTLTPEQAAPLQAEIFATFKSLKLRDQFVKELKAKQEQGKLLEALSFQHKAEKGLQHIEATMAASGFTTLRMTDEKTGEVTIHYLNKNGDWMPFGKSAGAGAKAEQFDKLGAELKANVEANEAEPINPLDPESTARNKAYHARVMKREHDQWKQDQARPQQPVGQVAPAQGPAPGGQAPQGGQPPVAPQDMERPFTPGDIEKMSQTQKKIVSDLHLDLQTIEAAGNLSDSGKAQAIGAIHGLHAMLARYGWLVGFDGKFNPAIAAADRKVIDAYRNTLKNTKPEKQKSIFPQDSSE